MSTDRIIRTDVYMQPVARDGSVQLLFSEKDSEVGELRPVAGNFNNFVMPASDALAFSTLLADLAFEAETGLKPAGDVVKSELIERHRTKLVDRLTVMLNSMRERKTTSNRGLAKQLVDTMLSEVFS